MYLEWWLSGFCGVAVKSCFGDSWSGELGRWPDVQAEAFAAVR